jgi:CRISPR/Cas system CSM-associated protein Csm2 small subunit
MRTQEARAVEVLAETLTKLLDKSEDGKDIYNDDKARKALRKLQKEISGWGLE